MSWKGAYDIAREPDDQLNGPARHRAEDAVDAEPGMPEAGVGVVHFPFGPRGFTVSGEALNKFRVS